MKIQVTTPTDQVAIAAALNRALGGQECRASIFTLDGHRYVVTTGTGEGYDFAYEPDDVGEIGDGWDYSTWCNGVQPVTDERVAIAYYMQTGRILGVGGSCVPVLSEDQIATLDIVRDLA